MRSPYPHLPRHLQSVRAIVLGDSTGARPHADQWWRVVHQNASRDGPIREIFRRFDQHVQRRSVLRAAASLFDQTVLSSRLQASYRPSLRRRCWARPRAGGLTGLPSACVIWLRFSRYWSSIYWSWSCCFDTPTSLPHPGGSYGATYGYRWASLELQHSDRASRAFTENIAKAPPWLFSAESDMSPPAWRIRGRGVRIDSRGWGAKPPPWVLSHFVCSGWPGSGGREQAMRLWGRWNYDAIGRELPEYGRSWHSQLAHDRLDGYAGPHELHGAHA